MDVFYHWKNYEADLKAGRIGYFKSTVDKLAQLADGFPDFVWVFKTPRGRKGEIQLVARLSWSDKTKVRLKPEPGHVYIHYDPNDEQSVSFDEAATESIIAETTRWASDHFPKMVSVNFQGAAGQEALRGGALGDLVRLTGGLSSRPFASTLSGAAASP